MSFVRDFPISEAYVKDFFFPTRELISNNACLATTGHVQEDSTHAVTPHAPSGQQCACHILSILCPRDLEGPG